MKFKCEIRCDNAAFDDAPATELARILEGIAHRVREDGHEQGTCRDHNGNVVGSWSVTGKRP